VYCFAIATKHPSHLRRPLPLWLEAASGPPQPLSSPSGASSTASTPRTSSPTTQVASSARPGGKLKLGAAHSTRRDSSTGDVYCFAIATKHPSHLRRPLPLWLEARLLQERRRLLRRRGRLLLLLRSLPVRDLAGNSALQLLPSIPVICVGRFRCGWRRLRDRRSHFRRLHFDAEDVFSYYSGRFQCETWRETQARSEAGGSDQAADEGTKWGLPQKSAQLTRLVETRAQEMCTALQLLPSILGCLVAIAKQYTSPVLESRRVE
jgi:hypothetical protein